MSDDLSAPIAFARQMREQGLRTQIYYEGRKFKAKMAYADKLKAPYAAIFGDDEIAAQKVSLKNMQTGEQQTLTYDEALAILQASVESRKNARIIEEDHE
jgi:histidyl-tRNA synthetase